MNMWYQYQCWIVVIRLLMKLVDRHVVDSSSVCKAGSRLVEDLERQKKGLVFDVG